MGNEVKSSSPSSSNSISKVLNDAWVYYYAIGMSYNEYWYGDTELCEFYRRVDKFKQKRENERCWVMGAYVYQAVLNASPVFHDFVKKGTKPIPYPDKPFPIDEEEYEKIRDTKLLERYNRFKDYINKIAVKKK